MEFALEIQGLTKKYDGFKLDDISLTLPGGCIMGFIGENGAGKSTTIKLILDLIAKDQGTITVLGQEGGVHSNKLLKENIGVVLDESYFPEALNAKQINLIMKNIYSTWDVAAYNNWMKRFELPEKKPFKAYSRGMKMKLAIAVALSHDSKLLILDEATSGLDPIIREEILDVFQEFIQDETHSVFMSSHIISDLEKICDYITFIHKGKLIFSEPKDELLEQFVLVKCSEADIASIPKASVHGIRKNSFGVEALVKRNSVPPQLVMDRVSIEDIMLYHIKEFRI